MRQPSVPVAGADPGSHPGSHCDGIGLIHFLLVVTGISCFVAGNWHLPLRIESQQREFEKAQLESEILEAHRDRRYYQRLSNSMREERHFRASVLRRLTGEHPDEVYTISEWLSKRQGRAVQEAP